MAKKGKDDLPKWLTLKQAATWLGVHPTTLRRWADNGEIAHILTPGGHRRFAASDVESFSLSRRQTRKRMPTAQILVEQTITRTRQDIAEQKRPLWLSIFDDAGRAKQRELGQQLLALSLQYISSPDPDIITQAHNLGHEYGRICRSVNMNLKHALEAMLFFRDRLLETALQLPETVHIKPDATLRLMRHINQLLNTVHLAIVEVYDDNTNTNSLPRA